MFFAALASIHCCDGIIWLALFIEVALVLIRARVDIALGVVVVTARESIVLLLFLIGPLEHHVAEGND